MSMTIYSRVHIFISGKVQGVYYRQNAAQKAQELDVYGWIRNLSDGRVESVMEGRDININKVLDWCKSGPKGAFVTDIKIINEKYENEFSKFDIIETL